MYTKKLWIQIENFNLFPTRIISPDGFHQKQLWKLLQYKIGKKNFKFNIYKAKITNVLISTDGGGCINELELIIVE